MRDISPEKIRQFLLTRYAEVIKGMGFDPVEVADSFDFLLSGVIDSFGILEMVGSIEDEFHIRSGRVGWGTSHNIRGAVTVRSGKR